MLDFTEVTNNIVFHSIILGYSDSSITLYVFSMTSYVIPSGLYTFNQYYLGLLIFLALFQNKLITISGISPITCDMSWAPLVHNSNCKIGVSCWNNQQEWLYSITIMYYMVLLVFGY